MEGRLSGPSLTLLMASFMALILSNLSASLSSGKGIRLLGGALGSLRAFFDKRGSFLGFFFFGLSSPSPPSSSSSSGICSSGSLRSP
uniref:Putative secreted protein n=1 Tax=Ixodes ricinus TaxID=34613 RepID=A0A6B0U8P7_IXORI